MPNGIIISCLLLLSCSCTIFASFTEEPFKPQKQKRAINKIIPEEIGSIAENFEDMNFVTSRPVIKKRPGMSPRSIAIQIDNAIFTSNYENFISLHESGMCSLNNLNCEHLESLTSQGEENSEIILRIILDSFEELNLEIRNNFLKYLKLAIPNGISIFKYLWRRYSGEFVDENGISKLLETAAHNKCDEVYNFIKEKIFINSELEEILKIALKNSAKSLESIKLLTFFMEMETNFDRFTDIDIYETFALKSLEDDNVEFFKLALSRGLNLDFTFKNGSSLLGKAVELNSCRMMAVLVEEFGFDIYQLKRMDGSS